MISSEGQLGDEFSQQAVSFAYEPRPIKVPKTFKIVSTHVFGAAILGLPKVFFEKKYHNLFFFFFDLQFARVTSGWRWGKC